MKPQPAWMAKRITCTFTNLKFPWKRYEAVTFTVVWYIVGWSAKLHDILLVVLCMHRSRCNQLLQYASPETSRALPSTLVTWSSFRVTLSYFLQTTVPSKQIFTSYLFHFLGCLMYLVNMDGRSHRDYPLLFWSPESHLIAPRPSRKYWTHTRFHKYISDVS